MSMNNQFETLLVNLESNSPSLQGKAIIELSELRRIDDTILNETPAQDTFWRNVYHNRLVKLTNNEDEMVHYWGKLAQLAIAFTKSENEQNKLLRHLASNDDIEIKQHAIEGLGLNRDQKSLYIFERYAFDTNRKIRAASIEGLGKLKAQSAISTLQEAACDSSAIISIVAINALASIGTCDVLHIFNDIMKNSQEMLKIDVLKAIVRDECTFSIPDRLSLIQIAIKNSNKHNVLYSAAISLSKIDLSSDKIMPLLEPLLTHENEHVRNGATKAIDKINQRKD